MQFDMGAGGAGSSFGASAPAAPVASTSIAEALGTRRRGAAGRHGSLSRAGSGVIEARPADEAAAAQEVGRFGRGPPRAPAAPGLRARVPAAAAGGRPDSGRRQLSASSSRGSARRRPRPKSAAQLIAEASAHDAPATQEAWKTFGTDTAAGRALRSLYGSGRRAQLSVKAPRPKQGAKLDAEARGSFIPGGAKPGAADPRSAKLDRAAMRSVELPPDYAQEARWERMRPALIDVHPGKRRTAEGIAEAERLAEQAADRPVQSMGRAVATDYEKRRLQLQFQFKGGKALPYAASRDALVGEVPMSLVAGKPVPSVAASRAKARKARAAQGGTREAEHRRPVVAFNLPVDDGDDDEPLRSAAEASARSPGRRAGPSSSTLLGLEAQRDGILKEAEGVLRDDGDVAAIDDVLGRLEAVDSRLADERRRLGRS